MNRRRVTVSPSKAPGICRSSVYLDLCFACLSDTGHEQYRGGIQCGAGTPRGACAHRLDRFGSAGEDELLGARVRVARPPADGARAGRPHRVGQRRLARALRERAERDRVGELGHRRGVAERDQPGQPDRVQLVARQQPRGPPRARARRAASRSAAGSPRRSPRPAARTPRACPRRGARRRRRRAGLGDRRPRRRLDRGCGGDERRHQPTLLRAAAPPAARARRSPLPPALIQLGEGRGGGRSTVRSICSVVCASDGNHASNCDGGG